MASRFNFNAITLTDAADITKIAENFNKIEANAITGTEVDTKINTAKTDINSSVDTKLNSYTKTKNLSSLATKKYSRGTSAPSGGSDGDTYDQYF